MKPRSIQVHSDQPDSDTLLFVELDSSQVPEMIVLRISPIEPDGDDDGLLGNTVAEAESLRDALSTAIIWVRENELIRSRHDAAVAAAGC